MAKTYTLAPASIRDLIADVMARSHQDLSAAGVTVTALLLTGGPLLCHGYPALAKVKINSLVDRVEGKSDATLVLDGDEETGWDSWPETKQSAVIDHELFHLQLVLGDDGRVEEDDCGRPKLKMRLHDAEIGAFKVIIERHGEAAPEAQAIAAVYEYIQGLFRF